MPQNHIKDPEAVLDFRFDWANTRNGGDKPDWLETGETISTYTVTPTDGITVDSDSLTDSNSSVTVWLSGGTAGTRYLVTNHIVTSSGREDDRTITIRVQER